jgi:hypothetical protein
MPARRAAILIKNEKGVSEIGLTKAAGGILKGRFARKYERRLIRRSFLDLPKHDCWICPLSINNIEILSKYNFKFDKSLKRLAKQGWVIDKNDEVIQETFNQLLDKVTENYDLKVCPNCYETKMRLLSVSPSGQSIEYECAYCRKKIRSKLLSDKKGSECVQLYNDIKQKAIYNEEKIEALDQKREIIEPFILV